MEREWENERISGGLWEIEERGETITQRERKTEALFIVSIGLFTVK